MTISDATPESFQRVGQLNSLLGNYGAVRQTRRDDDLVETSWKSEAHSSWRQASKYLITV